jgi:DNA-binding transcriptional ArsR family regulator
MLAKARRPGNRSGAAQAEGMMPGMSQSAVAGPGAGLGESAGSGRGHRPAPEHTHPDDVTLEAALAALADPVRLTIVRELAGSADWSRTCGSFDVPIGKAALSHHFGVLRAAGIIEQRDVGTKRANRLRRAEFDRRFPGLLALALRADRQ